MQEHDINILLLDIETAPNLAYVWGTFKQNISINQLVESSYVLCWAAKWLGEEAIEFDSINKSNHKHMIYRIHKMLDEADAVIHYNGSRFDIPTLNKEFIKYKLDPPSPYKEIDLLKTVRKKFRLTSNKLDYVTGFLDIGNKTEHEGFSLWVKCMNNDQDAWLKMQEYNENDVIILEKTYERIKGWISGHPNHGVHDDVLCCPNCGGTNYQRRGFGVTASHKYPRYQCRDCGKWFKGVSMNMLGEPKRFSELN